MLFHIISTAFVASLESIGQSVPILLYSLFTFAVLTLRIWRKERTAIKGHLKKTVETLAVAVLVWSPIFVWELGYQAKSVEVPSVLKIPAPSVPAIHSTVTVQPKESNDSLRRRTIRVADELYRFLLERQQHHPPFAYPDSSDPNPSNERKQAIKISQDYDQETQFQYMRDYKNRVVGIVKEYESKGIPTGFLESAANQRPLGWGIIGSQWEGSPNDELAELRNLAYRVDPHDNAIHF
jgi:hypothetical protein